MPDSPIQPDATSSRKRDHVQRVIGNDVSFRQKTTGLERLDFVHNGLPELDYEDIVTDIWFLEKRCSMPLLVSSMTGGYAESERINRELGEVCQSFLIPMGIGSQRQALEDNRYIESFRSARRAAPDIPLFGNIGAAELVSGTSVDDVRRLADMVEADAFAIHLNPLQELMQPEGTPRFRGVLSAIEQLNRNLGLPVIVKEVGAGLSDDVVRRLLGVGVRIVDIAGAGGTSWAGVEILRGSDVVVDEAMFWDWGIPTAEALQAARPLCDASGATLIASGGIGSPRDIAISIALGAHIAGTARPILRCLMQQGQTQLFETLQIWQRNLKRIMFLVGVSTISDLRGVPLRIVVPQSAHDSLL